MESRRIVLLAIAATTPCSLQAAVNTWLGYAYETDLTARFADVDTIIMAYRDDQPEWNGGFVDLRLEITAEPVIQHPDPDTQSLGGFDLFIEALDFSPNNAASLFLVEPGDIFSAQSIRSGNHVALMAGGYPSGQRARFASAWLPSRPEVVETLCPLPYSSCFIGDSIDDGGNGDTGPDSEWEEFRDATFYVAYHVASGDSATPDTYGWLVVTSNSTMIWGTWKYLLDNSGATALVRGAETTRGGIVVGTFQSVPEPAAATLLAAGLLAATPRRRRTT